MRLHSDWSYIGQEFGCSVRDNFLMAVRSLDNPRAVTPFLLEIGRRRFGLFLHVEKGNVQAARLPPDIAPVYYRPYFTFEPSERPPSVHLTLGDAVTAVAAGEDSVVVDQRLPVAVADELALRFSVRPEAGLEPGPVTARAAPREEVLARLDRHRSAAAHTARRLLGASPIRRRIEPYLEGSRDLRFEMLDRYLDQAGLAAVIVSSNLNVQEIAGVPVRAKRRPLAVLYQSGESAWIIDLGRGENGREFASAAAALSGLCSAGTIGVECEDVDCGTYRAFDLASRDTQPADRLLRRWRDRNTLLDLPFYVIATRASACAIEGALEFARHAIDERRPVTEMDAFAVYMEKLRSFVCEAMPGLRVARTLTNFHVTARTMFPANPAPFPLNHSANALKVDAGCLLFDEEGCLLGCSDIARTLALSEAGAELYEVFKQGVRDALIPSAAAGKMGQDMHDTGVEAVWGKRQRLSANSLFVDFDEPNVAYDRDVGHLLGKNNLAHLRFAHGDRERLQEGMIACCEYQWPLDGHAIAYEDTCLVTPEGGLNLTSDGQ
jgi:Xaa-Pro aminopeptidase